MKTSLLNYRSGATFSLALVAAGAALLAQQSAFADSLLKAGTNTAESGSVSYYADDSNPNETITRTAFASFGILRASSTSISNPNAFTPASITSASFLDDWTIDASGLSGTAGTVTVSFTIDGSLISVPYGTPTYGYQANATYAEARYIFGANNPTSNTKAQKHYGNGSISGQTFLGIEQTQVLNFTFGQAIEDVKFEIMTIASSAGGYGYSSESTADLSHTAVWGGFVEVRDSNGNLVGDYSFSSASGTDFTQPIPEPGACTLLVLSGMAFNFLRPRRRQTMTRS
jgi:hypothetical protein